MAGLHPAGAVCRESWSERVREEHRELEEKIKRLAFFMNGRGFSDLPEQHRIVLQRQLVAMNEYSGLLRSRLMCFAGR